MSRPVGERRLRWVPALVALFAVGGCSNATEVVPTRVEIFVASGDGQYGTTGQALQAPLQVYLRGFVSQLPQSNRNVVWAVVSGAAQITSVANTVTDESGSAQATVRLGSTTGEVIVRATVEQQPGASVDFRLFTVDRPTVASVSPSSAAPGESITITGTNFSPLSLQNVVLFSGIRGAVTSATMTQLTVTVPPCLPARSVNVTVQLGTVASGSRGFTVNSGGDVANMNVGDFIDFTDDEGLECITLPGAGAANYLVLVQSSSSMGAATYPYTLAGLGETAPAAAQGAALQSDALPRNVEGTQARATGGPDPQSAWDQRLREMERELTRNWSPPASSGGGAGPAGTSPPAPAPPTLNEVRDFQVWRPNGSVEVTAVARYIGQKAAFFVDEDAPAGGYTEADLQTFSIQFDNVIHSTVTSAFGGESDLDNNQRVIVLLSPVVNGLTPRGAGGFIAGFFFGLDLQVDQPNSNRGEIFYSVVPDPSGIFSDPRPRTSLLEIVPAILAHEFQHMVNFNRRVLVGGAPANEAVWLSEALAQYAEELVARAYDAQSNAELSERYRNGVRDRARRYLGGPDTVSLVISSGNGSLAERGAGILYMMYLADLFGADLPGRLTESTLTGVDNVEFHTGTQWGAGLSDWWTAIHQDGPGPESGARVYPTVDLRGFLGDPWPLTPQGLSAGDFTRTGSLRSAAVQYYIVNPSDAGSTTVRLGGEAGAASAAQAGLRMRIVRIQ